MVDRPNAEPGQVSRATASKAPRRAAVSEGRRTGQGDRDLLITRLEGVLERIVSAVPGASIRNALVAPTQISAIATLLEAWIQEHPEVSDLDPDAHNRIRLARARHDLLTRAQGTYSTTEAAEHLGISPEAVRKRLQRGRLLSFRNVSGEHRLPIAQFAGDHPGGTLAGLESVLDAMHVEDPWMRLQLFLDEDVLGALQEGRVADAVRAVRNYLPADEDVEG